ncbi:MAG: Patatin [Adhaeribacter sp.]|nr:Patatin [Adhaeribacter sp.]
MEISRNLLPFRIPAGYNGPKRSLVLAGGGMRLAYQSGVLKALEEHGLIFTHADGTSGGIFTLAMLLSGLTTDQMCQNWRTLNIKHFVSYLPLQKYLRPLQLAGFGDADGIRNKVLPHLGVDISKINVEKDLAGTFNVCNYSQKKNEAIPNGALTLPHLLAGVSLPLFMPAHQINNDWYIDAVWIKDANLLEAVKRGAEEIWLVWAIGNIQEYRNGSFNQYVHMIEMSANGALYAEIDYIVELNTRISRGDSPYGQKAPIIIHLIKPAYPLPLDPDLYFNKVNTTTLIDMGYADAKEYLASITTAVPIEAAAISTKMKSPGLAFSGRARLTGSLFNQAAVLYLSLNIHDIPAFIRQQEPYQFTVHLSLAGNPFIAFGYNGQMQLSFNPAQSFKEVYFEFRTAIDGKAYVITGRADLNRNTSNGNGLKAEVKVYAGTQAGNELVSSGDFSLSNPDWQAAKKSLTVYNAQNWFERRRLRKSLHNYFFSPN